MPFFTLTYRVLFHDTMAYGSHHHAVNFKFQNLARESMLFADDPHDNPAWKDQLKDLVLLTRDAYSLNFSPVMLGQKVVILMTYEEPTRSTVRLCFRVVREDGQPVSCGFQTMICMHKDTQELVPAPPIVTRFLSPDAPCRLLEPLTNPSFRQTLLSCGGAAKSIFPESVCQLGKYLAALPERATYPRIIDTDLREYERPSLETTTQVEASELGLLLPLENADEGAIVFCFPGQGTFEPKVLAALYHAFPEVHTHVHRADDVVRAILKLEFLSTVMAAVSWDSGDSTHQDLGQVGIYLTGTLIARILMSRGITPSLMVGHSYGELAALASANVYPIETGVELVCRRVQALRGSGAEGRMAAVSAGPDAVREALREIEPHSIEIAVVNHSRQTVVSGKPSEILRLRSACEPRAISVTSLASAFPFHSSHLAAAVEPFYSSIVKTHFGPAEVPIFLCTERALYVPGPEVALRFAQQFTAPLDFARAMTELGRAGFSRFVECGSGGLAKIVAKNLVGVNAATTVAAVSETDITAGIEETVRSLGGRTVDASNPPVMVKEETKDIPIAIVSMGCILPGASNPDHFWRNIMEGVSGIVDLAEIDPSSREDFLVSRGEGEIRIVPDKSYTLLNGSILETPYNRESIGDVVPQPEFESLTRGQRLLALTFGELDPHVMRSGTQGRVQCILGSTADGSSEFDEASLIENLRDEIEGIDEPRETRQALGDAIESVMGGRPAAREMRQYESSNIIAGRFLGRGTDFFIVDSACSSSLYAMHIGMRLLQEGNADMVIAGGVFAPGPANNTLFAQFGGLSPTGSRPLDATADGVVFGDGCALLALKRLPDALNSGDKVVAVIRGSAIASDGKSPSINVPQAKGQTLTVQSALQRSGIDIDTIQYIEAHATGTTVGDRVELQSLGEVFSKRPSSLPKIQIGSVKGLIGHTGWVSGAASVIKIAKALESRTVPKQFNFNAPDPEVGFEKLPFQVASEACPWPENRKPYPRRAGVNGFGFGGTNAHVVIEAFDSRYHRNLMAAATPANQLDDVVIVGYSGMFPAEGQLSLPKPTGKQAFNRKQLRLPARKLLLPDVTEQMDVTQFLAPLAAEKLVDSIRSAEPALVRGAGVVLGLESKTERSLNINKRIFLDQLRRRLRQSSESASAPAGAVALAFEKLAERVKARHPASGPYTLPGQMPNVTASRVASLYDMRGANLVIDRGRESLLQAVSVACKLLAHGDLPLVFAGGVNAAAQPGSAEAVFLMAMTTEKLAAASGLPVLARVVLAGAESAKATLVAGEKCDGLDYGACTAAPELITMMEQIASGQASSVAVSCSTGGPSLMLKAAEQRKKQPDPDSSAALLPVKAGASEISKAYAYVEGTPIQTYRPVLFPEARAGARDSLEGRKILILTDQPHCLDTWNRVGMNAGLPWSLAAPATIAGGSAVPIDVSSETALTESLHGLDHLDYSLILAVNFANADPAEPSESEHLVERRGLLDLLFSVSRRDYEAIANRRIGVAALTLGASPDRGLPPSSGLIGGFLKSLRRELPGARVVLVNTDETNLLKALKQLEDELGEPMSTEEVSYDRGIRHITALTPVHSVSSDEVPYLSRDSIVLATGGGRGVTAVLAEALLRRFECTVIAVGRTDPKTAPRHVLDMGESAFRAYEAGFYATEMAKPDPPGIKELKRRYAALEAANEVHRVQSSLRLLSGNYSYRIADITQEATVEELVDAIYREFGAIDLVIHGAGIQVSKNLRKKNLDDFQSIVATKISSLEFLRKAIGRRRRSRPVHYHLLTSAFSYLGNDGQPDYGAANEALNRLAETQSHSRSGSHWSSMGWLGWAGIGMTRGAEFAALAASRRLRAINREEGQRLFGDLMAGTPTHPINILLAEGEIQHYQPRIIESAPSAPRAASASPRSQDVFEWQVNLDNSPFLADHRVQGMPTIPAAFFTCMVADAAGKMRPEFFIAAFENTRYYRFGRVSASGAKLRVAARVVSEEAGEVRVHVQILSDFVHKSGAVLQKDIVHNETTVRMTARVPVPPRIPVASPQSGAVSLPDPYLLPQSNVQLKGPFAAMGQVEVGASSRFARYRFSRSFQGTAKYDYMLPNLVCVDAFWRFGTVQLIGPDTLGVYVPERCGVMHTYFDFLAFQWPALLEALTFEGENPRIDGDLLHVGPIRVRDAKGNILLEVMQGVCRKYGEVRTGAERSFDELVEEAEYGIPRV